MTSLDQATLQDEYDELSRDWDCKTPLGWGSWTLEERVRWLRNYRGSKVIKVPPEINAILERMERGEKNKLTFEEKEKVYAHYRCSVTAPVSWIDYWNLAGPINDPVNRPAHYTSGKIEVVDFIEDQKLGWHLGNALKYIARAGKKENNPVKIDLEKAIWYIRRFIDLNEKNNQRDIPDKK